MSFKCLVTNTFDFFQTFLKRFLTTKLLQKKQNENQFLSVLQKIIANCFKQKLNTRNRLSF